ncbi:MAG: hypothetical protein JXB42_07590, partial [Deltaproteobacteria bacterium]|nr:hypothetical protein [Deltaproteobacteria bacterium]
MPRGPWHYDGEIDLGYGGALRTAAVPHPFFRTVNSMSEDFQPPTMVDWTSYPMSSSVDLFSKRGRLA